MKVTSLGIFQFLFCFVLKIIYLRERAHMQAGEGQREKERESQAAFPLSAEPNMGIDLTVLRS